MAFRGLVAFVAAMPMLADDGLAADAEAGRAVFKKCIACHVADQSTNKLGPHLGGVVGRPAASVDNFSYSAAMKKAGADGLVWDEGTLALYLSDPKGFIPDNRMAFQGLKVPSDVENIIAYLKSIGG